MKEFNHKTVLLQESIENLNIAPNGIYVDATIGGGGHAVEILKRLESGMLIGTDQDTDALSAAKLRLDEYIEKGKLRLVHANFSDLKAVLNRENIQRVDGIIMDLGVSSFQLDEPSRGFSYNHDAPLDMRMNADNALSAYDIINQYPERRIARLLWNYGEERWAARIAQFICKQRDIKPIKTTFELVDIIKAAIPKKARENKHPAKRSFMAVRIEVNQELEILEKCLQDFVDILEKDGRLCIITFHSLEDRIIKQFFGRSESPCICPRDFPICACGMKPTLKRITRKPILPDEAELGENPRARSAKLRVAQKI